MTFFYYFYLYLYSSERSKKGGFIELIIGFIVEVSLISDDQKEVKLKILSVGDVSIVVIDMFQRMNLYHWSKEEQDGKDG